MASQWRNILLMLIAILETVYLAAISQKANNIIASGLKPTQRQNLLEWVLCQIKANGDKTQCSTISEIVGLNENSLLTTFFLNSVRPSQRETN